MTYDKVNCPTCYSEKSYVLYPDTLKDKSPVFNYSFRPEHFLTYQMIKCKSCGHVFSYPIPDDLYVNYQDVIDVDYLKHEEQRLLSARRVLRRMRSFCRSGRLLDIGCATGDFLSVAKDNYEVEGVEISNWSSKIAQEKGFMVHSCDLSNIKEEECYDIVTMWGVIEHFENPKEEIKKIHKLLKNGGYIFLWTGDVESLVARLLGRKWWCIQGQHVHLFSKRSLIKLFSDYGFEKLVIDIYPYATTLYSLTASIGRYHCVGKYSEMIMRNFSFLKNLIIPLYIPGEMLAVFRKV